MRVRPVLIASSLFLVVSAQVGADEVVRGLSHNPFNQPALVAQQIVSTKSGTLPVWSGSLQGVLLAGKDSLANVGGKLLGIGDVYEGYRLIRVNEESAIFSKGEQEIVVTIGSDSDEDDEE